MIRLLPRTALLVLATAIGGCSSSSRAYLKAASVYAQATQTSTKALLGMVDFNHETCGHSPSSTAGGDVWKTAPAMCRARFDKSEGTGTIQATLDDSGKWRVSQ
jgi:hypothetical protein